MKEKKETRGRKANEAAKIAVLQCVERGLGYQTSLPILKAKGFVDEDGNCTICRSSFINFKAKYSDSLQTVNIVCTSEEKKYIKEHTEEVLDFVRLRMRHS